jgi:hypothetical protein
MDTQAVAHGGQVALQDVVRRFSAVAVEVTPQLLVRAERVDLAYQRVDGGREGGAAPWAGAVRPAERLRCGAVFCSGARHHSVT